MSWSVKNGWHPPVGQFARKGDAQEMARQMRDANRQAGIRGAVKVVKTGTGNPSRRMTKTQRRANASRRSKQRRVAASLKKFLSTVAPAKRFSGAALRKNPGGSITITPLKAVKGHR
jgi:hypothetical protein